MDVVWGILVFTGHAIEAVLAYVETHHWIFGFLVAGYIFYLHDRAVHAKDHIFEVLLPLATDAAAMTMQPNSWRFLPSRCCAIITSMYRIPMRLSTGA